MSLKSFRINVLFPDIFHSAASFNFLELKGMCSRLEVWCCILDTWGQPLLRAIMLSSFNMITWTTNNSTTRPKRSPSTVKLDEVFVSVYAITETNTTAAKSWTSDRREQSLFWMDWNSHVWEGPEVSYWTTNWMLPIYNDGQCHVWICDRFRI